MMDGAGRRSLYKPEFAEQAYGLCLAGATNQELADGFDVGHSTIDNWLRNHSEFAQAVRSGRSLADGKVAHALYSRAVGYSYESTRVLLHCGEPVAVRHTVHLPPDIRAGIFWLRNRRPQQWRTASRQARDVCPADGELAHHAVVAPVEMIEAAEPRLAASAEARDDKSGGRAYVAADHGRPLKPLDAADQGGSAADGDARAHPDQFVDMPEALLEDRLADGAGAGRRRQQRHDRRLQVGGEAGIGAGRDVDASQPMPGPSGNDPVRRFAEIDTHGAERCGRAAEQVDAAVGQAEFAVGDGRGAGEGAELDAIRQDGMHGAGEPRGALDAELMRAEAGDLGAHRDQAGGQVGDLGLARGIADSRRALGQGGAAQPGFRW